jgi:transposase
MRFVPIKNEEQQAVLVMHRSRDLLVRQRTQLINALRGHLSEFGLIEAQGPSHVRRLLESMQADSTVPQLARDTLALLASTLDAVSVQIDAIEAKIAAWHKVNPTSQRLATIPGIGPLIASAITATVTDPAAFRGGREFAAWLGLTPRQKSTGGKQRLGRISRKGDQYLRRLLIIGAQTVLLRFEGGSGQSMDSGSSRALCAIEGGGGVGQQNSKDRLGGDDARRILSAGRG